MKFSNKNKRIQKIAVSTYNSEPGIDYIIFKTYRSNVETFYYICLRTKSTSFIVATYCSLFLLLDRIESEIQILQ